MPPLDKNTQKVMKLMGEVENIVKAREEL